MILFCPPLLGEQGLGDANRDTKGHLAGSFGRACGYQWRSHEFKPCFGHGARLIKKERKENRDAVSHSPKSAPKLANLKRGEFGLKRHPAPS